MNDMNGHSPDPPAFDALAEQIEALYDIAAAKRDHLKAELAAADAEAKQLERMLNIARPPEPQAASSKPKPKAAREAHTRVSPETLERVINFMATHDPAPQRGFERDDIAEAVGLSKTTAGYALIALRDEERVRLVGRAARKEGQMGQLPYLYAVMPSGE